MKAIFCERVGDLQSVTLQEVPEVVPRAHETVVAVHAAGLNRADLLQMAGRYPAITGETALLGLECAGIDLETGQQVCALLPGGGFAERVAVPREMLMPIPKHWSLLQAAAMPEAFLTAYLNLYLHGKLENGERVLVHAAASGVGTAAIMLAKIKGCDIIATTRSEEKRTFLQQLGASLVLCPSPSCSLEQMYASHLPAGVDVILDVLGGACLNTHLNLLHQGGRLTMIALMQGARADIDLSVLLRKDLQVTGSTLRTKPLNDKIKLVKRFLKDIAPLFDTGQLTPVLDSVWPVEQAKMAFLRMKNNQNQGKIVLDWQALCK